MSKIDLGIKFPKPRLEAPVYCGGFFSPGSEMWKPQDVSCGRCSKCFPLKKMKEKPNKSDGFKAYYLCRECYLFDQTLCHHNLIWVRMDAQRTEADMISWDLFLLNEYRKYLKWDPARLCSKGCLRPVLSDVCRFCHQ